MRGFFRLWVWFSFRELRGHAWRTVVVLVGISLGAAVFTSVRLATTLRSSPSQTGLDAISGRAERTVTLPGGRLPEVTVSVLFNSPTSSLFLLSCQPTFGWKEATNRCSCRGLIQYSAAVADMEFRAAGFPGSLFPVAPPDRHALHRRSPRQFLEKRSVQEVESVRLQGPCRTLFCRAGGGRQGNWPPSRRNIAIVDIATFQEFTGVYGEIDRIDHIFTHPLTADKLDRVKKLAAGAGGRSCAALGCEKKPAGAMIRAYEMNLSVLNSFLFRSSWECFWFTA